MYEVLGLFILLIVGVVLIGEAGVAAAHAAETAAGVVTDAAGSHTAHDNDLAIKIFGYELVPMSKTTFYFSVLVLFAVEILQSGYRRKLDAERAASQNH